MEIPYRRSTAGSEEGQRASIIVPAVSPQVLSDTTNLSVPTSTAKVTSVASAVSNLLTRSRQCPSRPCNYEEMNWTLRRKSSNNTPIPEEIVLNNNDINKDANDYRVTVV